MAGGVGLHLAAFGKRVGRRGMRISIPAGRRKDTIWMITKRDVHSREIEFVRATPESRIARLTIAVDEKEAQVSKVQITYVITALCEEGNQFLEAFTEEKFTEVMKFWEKSMNYYLETGKKLGILSDV